MGKPENAALVGHGILGEFLTSHIECSTMAWLTFSGQ